MASITKQDIITIIGAGMGGKGLAAQLGINGFRLRIHDIDDTQVAGMRAAGGLHIEGRDIPFAPVEMATTDLAAAVKGAAVLIVSTYGTDHPVVARNLVPLLEDGQTIVLCQGHFGGALLFRAALDRLGCKAKVDIAEMDSYPYMLHVKAPDRVIMTTIKTRWNLVAMPAARSAAVLERVGIAFPNMVTAPNLLHTGFVDLGAIFHVAGMVTNVSRVENDESYNFYTANMVPTVCDLIAKLDAERVAVAAAYGAKIMNVRDWLELTYQLHNPTLQEDMQEMGRTHFRYAPAPKSLQHRYLVQDVACGLVPIACLGPLAGVPTPAADTVIRFAGLLTNRDFYAEGRNLHVLGLEGKTVAQIVQTVTG
ncbi:NAD/NADP octopine/nopaline dehydrogenase family protein [Ferrovibrio sp.]|uniref:NAD/NADP octopine/nopaline dehydrogenase family protein n=1 Tax=Ferrovibrio sp. TaxID=1917215 RepID=UPI003D12974C